MEDRRLAWLGAIGAFLAAGGVGLWLLQPRHVGMVGFDSAASVIYFERIVSGHVLEAFVTATPKPLLTLIDGGLYALSHDWRPITLADVGAYALSAALAWWLFRRLAGPAAGAFAAAAMVGSGILLSDLIYAYAVPWATLFWLLAGLAATAPRPRYLLAGLCLMLATLARLETLVLTATIVAALIASAVLARTRLAERLGVGQPPRGSWWLLSALLALPVMLLHDQLLAGDPFFWMKVSAHYSAAAPAAVATPLQIVRFEALHLRGEPILVILAGLGAIWVVRARAWSIGVGLVGLGPGVAAFLVLLAARGTYVSTRYIAAVDIALICAAALGVGLLSLDRWLDRLWSVLRRAAVRSRVSTALAFGAALVLAVLAVWPAGLLDQALVNLAARQNREALHADAAARVLDVALDAIPGSRTTPAGIDWRQDGTVTPILVVPALERPRLAVALDLPLSRIRGLGPADLEPGPGFLAGASLAFHDRLGDLPASGYRLLEVEQPTPVDGGRLVPLSVHPYDQWWVVRFEP